MTPRIPIAVQQHRDRRGVGHERRQQTGDGAERDDHTGGGLPDTRQREDPEGKPTGQSVLEHRLSQDERTDEGEDRG